MVETFTLLSDEVGDYTTVWIPQIPGEYLVRTILTKDNEQAQKEKTETIETISPHFSSTLTAKILLQ